MGGQKYHKELDRLFRSRKLNWKFKFDNPRFIAAYCDASFHERGRCGGWGAWVRDDFERLVVGNKIFDINTSYQAELFAVRETIKVGVENLNTERSDIFVVKTDCQQVAKFFGWGGS